MRSPYAPIGTPLLGTLAAIAIVTELQSSLRQLGAQKSPGKPDIQPDSEDERLQKATQWVIT
jgi:hypothetical protein